MTELLTSRQVQEILKVDRITVYRMLQDGRLKGIKIGQQWRFHRNEVELMLGVQPPAEQAVMQDPASVFPVHCVQTIQDLFSDVSQISALVVDSEGNPVTRPSNLCSFCTAVQSSQSGRTACQESWKSFYRHSQNGSQYFTCHAGLQYIGAPIMQGEVQVGLFLTGGLLWQAPDPREQGERVRRLSAAFHLPQDDLQKAAENVPIIDPGQQARVESWPFSAARAVQSILNERTGFMARLQQIANLTQVP